MPDAPANAFAAFFLKLAERQLYFLALVGAATIFFALYGYGLTWISFWIVSVTVFMLGLFAGLIWFWRGVFKSMLDRSR